MPNRLEEAEELLDKFCDGMIKRPWKTIAVILFALVLFGGGVFVYNGAVYVSGKIF